MWNTPSLPILPGPLLTEVIVPGTAPSVSQIEIFNYLLYQKNLTVQIKLLELAMLETTPS